MTHTHSYDITTGAGNDISRRLTIFVYPDEGCLAVEIEDYLGIGACTSITLGPTLVTRLIDNLIQASGELGQ